MELACLSADCRSSAGSEKDISGKKLGTPVTVPPVVISIPASQESKSWGHQ
jgi:hypothetical protein